MSFYLVLTFGTLAIIFLQYLIWKKNRSILFPLATLFLYYWTILGGWFIVFDLLNNNASEKIGVHYYDYFKKLFPIELNNDYLLSLVYFILFVIAFQVIIFFTIKKSPPAEFSPVRIKIRHQSLILISLFSIALSFFFIYQQMKEAAQHHESIYIFISHNNGKFYSLFQIFKSCSLITAFGGMVIYMNGEQNIFFEGNKLRFGIFNYILLMLVVLFYSMLLGSRHDLVFAGLFSLILYFINGKKIVIKDLVLIISTLVLPVFLVELTRGIPILDYLGLNFGSLPKETEIKLNGHQALMSILLSNEIFAGHMSMYGALHWHLPFTYGSSFYNLLTSFIPRFIIPERPMDIYQYYISVAQNPGLQGFTINHATAWYLNFGITGLIGGGIIFGAFVSMICNRFYKTEMPSSPFLYCLKVLAVPGIMSFIPMLIRTGPEGYKGLLFEGILIPVLLFWFAQINLPRLFTFRSSSERSNIF